jgi:gas vesicle protein
MERRPDYDEGFSTAAVILAFLSGAAIGTLAALLLAPEAGADIRQRLRRGAKTAQEELTDVAVETREAFEALTKDARQTIRQTAARLNAALGATREALQTEIQALKGPTRE